LIGLGAAATLHPAVAAKIRTGQRKGTHAGVKQ
jgi:hypothetical protein